MSNSQSKGNFETFNVCSTCNFLFRLLLKLVYQLNLWVICKDCKKLQQRVKQHWYQNLSISLRKWFKACSISPPVTPLKPQKHEWERQKLTCLIQQYKIGALILNVVSSWIRIFGRNEFVKKMRKRLLKRLSGLLFWCKILCVFLYY